VRLRLEGVDAPELHYGSAAQPLGREARDQLLAWIGFTELEYAPPAATRIAAAGVEAVPAVIFTQAAELHGRPVAYLVTTVGKDEHLPPDGQWAPVDRAVLDHTFNTLLVQEGWRNPTVHASTPVAHQGYLRDLAAETRKTGAGIWADDTSA
jgi:endonuclease YncB( thermonuclease family)